MSPKGILLLDKPAGFSSFAMVAKARRIFGVQKIGHGGTLDPFATGLLVLLIGREYTKRASEFLEGDKEYQAKLFLGVATDTYDLVGKEISRSDSIPTHDQLIEALGSFQGTILQTPPMFSAKKIDGKRLYELARKGQVVERQARPVQVTTKLLSYDYPHISLHVTCSKGTYIRSIAHDLGVQLGCYAHLQELRRLRCGCFTLEQACTLEELASMPHPESKLQPFIA
jgi:tRNA pseudouridine55 synthase